MSGKKFEIEIPDEMVQDLNLEEDHVIYIKKEPSHFSIKRKRTEFDSENVSLRWFLIPVIISSIIFFSIFMYKKKHQIPMNGSDFSIATGVIFLGILSGSISFIIFLIREKLSRRKESLTEIPWRNIPTIIVSYVVMLALACMSFFWIVEEMFDGATFGVYTSTIIFILFSAIINYIMIYAAVSFNSQMIVTLLVLLIVGGVLLSMLSNSQDRWWKHNFSYLGTQQAYNSWQFNLTLILSAFLMMALIDYLFVHLKKNNYTSKGLVALRVLLTLFALCLGAVGVFPNNGRGDYHYIHDHVAYLLVVIVILLMIGIKWLLPDVSKEFLTLSFVIAFLLIMTEFLFKGVHYLSLTAYELLSFGLGSCWVVLLLQHMQKLSKQSDYFYEVPIENISDDSDS